MDDDDFRARLRKSEQDWQEQVEHQRQEPSKGRVAAVGVLAVLRWGIGALQSLALLAGCASLFLGLPLLGESVVVFVVLLVVQLILTGLIYLIGGGAAVSAVTGSEDGPPPY